MQKIPPLEHGKYYHIYNRGNNSEDLFKCSDNYLHFLNLYDKYIDLVADTFAYCLMPNHFHLLVRIREENEIFPISKNQPLSGHKASDRVDSSKTLAALEDGKTLSAVANPDSGLSKRISWIPKPDKQFSHLFNSYAQAFNKQQNRHGSLFETPFHRIPIDSDKYFCHLVYYIHNNPVHHGLMEHLADYPWSSYQTIISNKVTKLKRKEVIDWFDDFENFISFHKYNHDIDVGSEFAFE